MDVDLDFPWQAFGGLKNLADGHSRIVEWLEVGELARRKLIKFDRAGIEKLIASHRSSD